ncbi:MAG TPA: peptidoglycan DD-metalloendopeptidase family protein [Gemmatimonadota bacterium]|nr:peptidoglycan DD-metalloendopeptidase family protein [Gemmatimonadota bacterium]
MRISDDHPWEAQLIPTRGIRAALAAGLALAAAPAMAQPDGAPAPLPDPTGWGTHVLALEVAPDRAIWVGTYGQGIYVSRDGTGREWEQLTSADSTGISWDFVNAFAFAPGEVWYGTIGNGWGVSRDGGDTWRNWTFDELGPRWQYVAPGGVRAAGDTIYVATADGLRISADDGETWRDVTDESGLPNKYLLSLEVEPVEGSAPRVRVTHLRGASSSEDGGRTWTHEPDVPVRRTADVPPPDAGGVTGAAPQTYAVAREVLAAAAEFRDYDAPEAEPAGPGERAHFWFRRPIDPADNTYLDQTYTYGSTMGGNFQQHQGVEFNNPERTPVHAIGDGVVAFAGSAEAGSNTVAILHDRKLGDQHVWSTYYHNHALTVEVGQRVAAGDIIAHVGNTGRATNDHLHLEIHTTPGDDVSLVVDPEVRYPPYTRNPQLWIEPLPGTGAIAGRVLGADGSPVAGARVYGVVKPEPRETPFSFAETYEDRAHPDPVFEENFAIGDVPAGEWVLGAEIDGQRVFRRVRVEAGRVTEVELRR